MVSQYAAPEPGSVASRLASEFSKAGHEVALLTGYPNYPTGQFYPGFVRSWFHKEQINGIQLGRCWHAPHSPEGLIKRCWNYGSFAISALWQGCRFFPVPDVIWAYHPPATIGPVAHYFARQWGVPWVLHVADLWPEAGPTSMR